MFYIREIGQMLGTYQPGMLRAKRATTPVSAVSTVGGQGVVAETPGAVDPATTPVLNAYERAINPDTPRRRVMYAAELMSKGVVTIPADATLREASDLFALRRFRHVPVVNQESDLVGVLSDRDLMRRAAREDWDREQVRTVMTHPVLVASPDTEMREVARVMIEERVGCMPIVEESGKLVGIITRSDVLRTLVVQAPLELWR